MSAAASSPDVANNTPIRLAATGLFTPPQSISNDELVESYNKWVDEHNAAHPDEEAKTHSSAPFIEKASGIKSRYVLDKEGILDTSRMRPSLPNRPDSNISILAEIAVKAARDAMKRASLTSADIDTVICACSNLQRAYPAIAVEIQAALGIDGYGFDMNVACASAPFAVHAARGIIANGARRVLIVNPEICSAHLNFRDRDCHFIFGDVATAMIIESADHTPGPHHFDILDTRLKTVFSNNIRNNFGFLSHTMDNLSIDDPDTDNLFMQNGRSVFKEVVPMVSNLITTHLEDNTLNATMLKRLWLHQANLNMNLLISKKVLGRDADKDEAPAILDRYANTSSAGSIIAFHQHHDDLSANEIGVICAFGAGYSAGSVIVKKTV